MPAALSSSKRALRDQERALPIVVAVDRDENAARRASCRAVCTGSPACFGDPHPQHIHRRAEIFDGHSGARRASSSAGRRCRRRASRGSSSCRRHWSRDAGDAAVARRASRCPRVSIRRRNVGYRLPFSARKLRKSHCGISAMNLQCVGRCVKSATSTCSPPILAPTSLSSVVRQS